MKRSVWLAILAGILGCNGKEDTDVVDSEPVVDADSDGFDASADCDDTDPSVFPGNSEVPYDGFDNDCDGETLDDDLDSDGFIAAEDCDDTNSDINAASVEIAYDGVDNDCDATTPDDDFDADGYPLATDCDDDRAAVHPGQNETPYNGIDDDCDGTTPDDDVDGDGFLKSEDCDDTNADIHRGAAEVPYNGQNDDCNTGTPDDDLDRDGFPRATDCDDTQAAINPSKTEIPYNGVDDDCAAATLDDDLDGDTFPQTTDCNDTNASVHPGAMESPYNGFDDDCNGATPDDDLDRDGFVRNDDCDDANAAISPVADEAAYNGTNDDCDATTPDDDLDGDGFIRALDCDDANGLINPAESETSYNGVDDDCDGSTPDDDLDGDGFDQTDDCNDANAAVHPAATEIPYNGVNDDCSSTTPDDDVDGDTFLAADDCDDSDPDINPAELDTPYDGVDNDCDAFTPDDDLDGDGFELIEDCDDENAATNPDESEVPYNSTDDDCNAATADDDLDNDEYNASSDCNDANAAIHPGALEIPDDGIDNDCDGKDATTDDTDDTDDTDSGEYLPLPEACYVEIPACDVDVSGATPFVTRDIPLPALPAQGCGAGASAQTLGVYGEPLVCVFSPAEMRPMTVSYTYADVAGCPRVVAQRTHTDGRGDSVDTKQFDEHGRLVSSETSTEQFGSPDHRYTTYRYDDATLTVEKIEGKSAMSHGICAVDRAPTEAHTLTTYDPQGNPVERQEGDVDFAFDALLCQYSSSGPQWETAQAVEPICESEGDTDTDTDSDADSDTDTDSDADTDTGNTDTGGEEPDTGDTGGEDTDTGDTEGFLPLPAACFPQMPACDEDVSDADPFVTRDHPMPGPPRLGCDNDVNSATYGVYGEPLTCEYTGRGAGSQIERFSYTLVNGCPQVTHRTTTTQISQPKEEAWTYDLHGRLTNYSSSQWGFGSAQTEHKSWFFDDATRTLYTEDYIGMVSHGICAISRYPSDVLTKTVYDAQGNPVETQTANLTPRIDYSSCQLTWVSPVWSAPKAVDEEICESSEEAMVYRPLPATCYVEEPSCDEDVSSEVPFVTRDLNNVPRAEEGCGYNPTLTLTTETLGAYDEPIRCVASGRARTYTYVDVDGCPRPATKNTAELGGTAESWEYDVFGRPTKYTVSESVLYGPDTRIRSWQYDDTNRTVTESYYLSQMGSGTCAGVTRIPSETLVKTTFDEQGNAIERQTGKATFYDPADGPWACTGDEFREVTWNAPVDLVVSCEP